MIKSFKNYFFISLINLIKFFATSLGVSRSSECLFFGKITSLELDILLATASQLNRGAVDEIEFDHSHIAGGLSKIQTADNVIGIFSSRAMRERGRIQIQFMKTRSSSGVGQKVDLEFDLNTLRLRDLSEEDQEEQTSSSIFENIKKKSTMNKIHENQVVDESVDHADKLKTLLKTIN